MKRILTMDDVRPNPNKYYSESEEQDNDNKRAGSRENNWTQKIALGGGLI